MSAEPTLDEICNIAFLSLSRALGVRFQKFGISAAQWHVLRVLWNEEGISATELSRRGGHRQPTTTAALQRLRRQGLVRITRSPVDKRRVQVFLSAKARALETDLFDAAAETDSEASRGIPPQEIAVAHRALRQVLRNLRAVEPSDGSALQNAAAAVRAGSKNDCT